ncbi:MAG: hypothetical protein HC912_05365, partial [Saprospiraceae bacterium]|nr:hypothetical protein [Saprospiraceae bacterium]
MRFTKLLGSTKLEHAQEGHSENQENQEKQDIGNPVCTQIIGKLNTKGQRSYQTNQAVDSDNRKSINQSLDDA